MNVVYPPIHHFLVFPPKIPMTVAWARMKMMLGQGGEEAAPPAGGEPTSAAVIVGTTIILFLFFINQVFFSRPRNKGGVSGQALVNANESTHCCANCGEEGGVSLKVCKSCMLVK
jgi:hypothetical protein